MPWNDTTKIMTAPLNINARGDIQYATDMLGHGDLGDCIVNGTINKWAKWKPERSSKITPLTLADRSENLFGLNVTPCGPNGIIANWVANYGAEWTYLAPRDNGSDKFRFFDFLNATDISANGYNANCVTFLNENDQTLPSTYLVGNGGTGITFRVGLTPSAQLPSQNITLADLMAGDAAYSSFYGGLVFVYSNTYRLVTSSSPISSDAYGYEVTIAEIGGVLDGITTGRTYTVYPCLSELPHPGWANFANTDRIVSLPISQFSFQAKQVSTAQNMFISRENSYITDRPSVYIEFKVSMSATGGASTTISDAVYTLYSASSSGDTSGSRIASGSVGTLTTTTPQTVTRNLNITTPSWIRIYVERSGSASVNTEAWVKVRDGDTPPVPVD